MPLTTTALWPDLVAGRKAKASEVEAKFDWLEGSLLPMSGGNLTNNAYDLGISGNAWRSTWTYSINPTSTAGGISIGKLSPLSATCLDLSASKKAVYLPVLNTTERDALTAAAGMIIYNSTTANLEKYEVGAWKTLGEAIGGTMVTASIVLTTFPIEAELVNITTQGFLRSFWVRTSAGATNTAYSIDLVIDGATTTQASLRYFSNTPSSYSWIDYNYIGNTATSTTPVNISTNFRTSLQISASGTIFGAGSNTTAFIQYQRN